MFSLRQPPKPCTSTSHISRQLLLALQLKPSPFLIRALHPHSTKPPPVRPHEPKRLSSAASHHQTKPLLPQERADTLNPPPTTLPPPLTLPTREPSQSRAVFYFRTGRAYLTFYKTGIKAIWSNYKLLRQLRSRIPRDRSLEQALRDGVIRRAVYHFARRTRSDIARIPLFGLMLCIFGEFTPLVVIFLSGAVPRTCHIPRQIESAREKAEARRRISFREGTVVDGKRMGKVEYSGELPKPILRHVGRTLGLYSNLWDRIGVTPTILLPRRIRKATERIEADDLAIFREGGMNGLSEEEAKLAAEARGLDVVGRLINDIRSELNRWMEARKRKDTSVIGLLCRRPSAWPRN
ncbi:MAG: hypothetical protein LQ346_001560 [Caloplaca aetnensis]|nr:MAG: hypothetical protein LQ346_001560 [Caloplaca aetnensis]